MNTLLTGLVPGLGLRTAVIDRDPAELPDGALPLLHGAGHQGVGRGGE